MKVLASLSILLALLAVSQATAETRSITIGKFTYLGTGTQTRSDGTVIQGVSSYELVFDTGGVTAEPIPFSNAILFVKGSSQGTQSSGFPTITTGNGCGQNDSFPPCDLIFEGGPSSAGFQLAPCALQDNVTQTCISIALQLVSLTGKNFSFLLADGEQFCAFGINNTFVLANHEAALDPQCDEQGFCKGASAPIVTSIASGGHPRSSGDRTFTQSGGYHCRPPASPTTTSTYSSTISWSTWRAGRTASRDPTTWPTK